MPTTVFAHNYTAIDFAVSSIESLCVETLPHLREEVEAEIASVAILGGWVAAQRKAVQLIHEGRASRVTFCTS